MIFVNEILFDIFSIGERNEIYNNHNKPDGNQCIFSNVRHRCG